jgi:hypothetical protein
MLGSHTEHNPICNSIKACTKTRLGLDYNSPRGKAPLSKKCHAVALEFVNGVVGVTSEILKFLKLKFRFFEKKIQTIFITIRDKN